MRLFHWIARLFGFGPNRSRGNHQGAPADLALRPVKRLEGLELGKFAPLETEQLTTDISLGGNTPAGAAWFGRRDRIPPTSDPRTGLIDRLMVTSGIASNEELATIHRVQEEFDRLGAKGDSPRVADRQERQRQRQEQRKGAAERREQRRAETLHRRTTDIVYLGRGVSRGLADRTVDAQRLQSFGLPVLATPGELAEALGITISRLRWLAWHTEAADRVHYIQFAVPKRGGGTRTLAAPHQSLRRCQEWIAQELLARIPIHEQAHGFVPGRSTVTNAEPHVGQGLIVNADLKDFFPSITFPRIMGSFRSFGYSPAVATILALLVTECPRQLVRYAGRPLWVATGKRSLPQGAPTSPALSNIVAWKLDCRLAGLANSLGWKYTRYADDMTFSTGNSGQGQVGYLLARLRHLVENEGFTLHPDKTRVQRPNTRQSVTGIVVNERMGVPRATVRRLRAILHNAERTGLAAQNREQHPHFESWVAGMIAYVKMVNPDQAAGLVDAWERLRAQA